LNPNWNRSIGIHAFTSSSCSGNIDQPMASVDAQNAAGDDREAQHQTKKMNGQMRANRAQ
jgi:hypothetical protein